MADLLLLEDDVSYVLLEDGVDRVLLEDVLISGAMIGTLDAFPRLEALPFLETYPRLIGTMTMALVPDSDNLITVTDLKDAEDCTDVTDATGTWEVAECDGTVVASGSTSLINTNDYVGRMTEAESAALVPLKTYTVTVVLTSSGRDRTFRGQQICTYDPGISQCQ